MKFCGIPAEEQGSSTPGGAFPRNTKAFGMHCLDKIQQLSLTGAFRTRFLCERVMVIPAKKGCLFLRAVHT